VFTSGLKAQVTSAVKLRREKTPGNCAWKKRQYGGNRRSANTAETEEALAGQIEKKRYIELRGRARGTETTREKQPVCRDTISTTTSRTW
jgi:hypothetical protein